MAWNFVPGGLPSSTDLVVGRRNEAVNQSWLPKKLTQGRQGSMARSAMIISKALTSSSQSSIRRSIRLVCTWPFIQSETLELRLSRASRNELGRRALVRQIVWTRGLERRLFGAPVRCGVRISDGRRCSCVFC